MSSTNHQDNSQNLSTCNYQEPFSVEVSTHTVLIHSVLARYSCAYRSGPLRNSSQRLRSKFCSELIKPRVRFLHVTELHGNFIALLGPSSTVAIARDTMFVRFYLFHHEINCSSRSQHNYIIFFKLTTIILKFMP